MQKITIENTLGNSVELQLPEHPKDIKITKYIDFVVAIDKFMEWFNGLVKEDSIIQNRSMYVYKLCGIVSEYFDVDLNHLIHYDVSNLLDDEGQLKSGVMMDHITKLSEGKSDLDEVEDVLLSLVLKVNHVIQSYEPELKTEDNYIFSYKGEDWELPKVAVLAANHVTYPKVTVKELVECLEIQRLSAESKETDGSNTLTEYLNIFAILCRKVGEPIDVDNFSDIVEARLHHFIDLDMATVKDVVFFCQVTLKNYAASQIQDSFSMLQRNLQEVAQSKKASAKPKEGQK